MLASVTNQKFRLRVRYSKTGRGAWLSQLECVRAIERMIRRSGLPFCVSEGFSPHMKISFGPALSVGIESESQIFDVYLSKYIKPDLAFKMLCEQACCEIIPLSANYVDNTEVGASSIFGVSKYKVVLDGIIKEIVCPETIEVIRKKKKKIIRVDKFLRGDIVVDKQNENSVLEFCLESFDDGSLRPDLFVENLLSLSGASHLKIKNFKKL